MCCVSFALNELCLADIQICFDTMHNFSSSRYVDDITSCSDARYGTAGVGDGEFDTNRAAKGYDW